MSRKQTALAGLLGTVGGVLAGSPYLNDAGPCIAAGGNSFQCGMNEVIGPFISAIAIGFCVAIAIGHCLSVMSRRLLGPSPASKASPRAAVEVDDPYLQMAAWGMPPRPNQRGTATAATRESGVASPPDVAPTVETPSGPPLERVRTPSRIGGVGARGKPVPTPHRTA